MALKRSDSGFNLDPGDRIGGKKGGGNGKKSRIHWLVHFFILLVLFVGALGLGVWYLMSQGPTTLAERQSINVPLIKADKDPHKVRPVDPGGMDVPGRDRLVYGRLEGEGAKAVETLLPPPEEPLPPPAPGETVIATFGENPAPEPAPEPTPAPPAPEPKVAPKPAPAPPPEEKPAPERVAPPAPSSSGAYLIQMASLRDEGAATREWARLQKAHTDVLGSLTVNIQRADLGAKGVYWRLRAGFVADRDAAAALCQTLKARKVPCLPVKGDR